MFFMKDLATDAKIVYEPKGMEPIEFHVEEVVNRRLREELTPQYIFTILNEYLEHKGITFKRELYNKLIEAKNAVLLSASEPVIEEPPIKELHAILDMFPFEDMKDFVKRSNLVKIPSQLPETWDEAIEADEKGSREQTYLIEDYIELVALLNIIKTVFGPLGEFATINKDKINPDYRDMMLFKVYLTHPVFQTPPFQKIYQSIEKLVMRLESDKKNLTIRIIERKLGPDVLALSVTASVTIQKLLFNSEVLDTTEKHTIAKIYNYAHSKIKPKETVSDVVIKTTSKSDETGEPESVLESYRISSKLTPGFKVEQLWVTSDIYRMAEWLNLKTSPVILDKIRDSLNIYDKQLPIKEAIDIMTWIIIDIIHPDGVEYLKLDNVKNCLAVSIAWLIENDFGDIALFLGSIETESKVFKFNISFKNKIPNEVKERLKQLYIIDIEETITEITKKLTARNLITILPEDIYEPITGSKSREVKVKEDIKIRLAELCIRLGEIS